MNRYKEERIAYQEKRTEELQNTKSDEKITFFTRLLIFNHLIKELVRWKKEVFNQAEEITLKSLSFVPIMKCLYINCLLSVNIKQTEDTSSLFIIFDFDAFPKGGLNKDCYYFMDKLPDYTIRDNGGLEYLSKRQSNSNNSIETLSSLIKVELTDKDKEQIKDKTLEYKTILEETINDLKKATCFPEFKEKEKLIDLTHMKIWNDAFKDSAKMNTEHGKDLIEEALFLRWRIGAQL